MEVLTIHLPSTRTDAAASAGRLNGGLGDIAAGQFLESGACLGQAQPVIGIAITTAERCFDIGFR